MKENKILDVIGDALAEWQYKYQATEDVIPNGTYQLRGYVLEVDGPSVFIDIDGDYYYDHDGKLQPSWK